MKYYDEDKNFVLKFFESLYDRFHGRINFFSKIKDYILFTILIIISLFLVTENDKPQMKSIKTFAFGGYATISSLFTSIFNDLEDDEELLELKKINAELLLENNKLREYGLENKELKNLLALKDSSFFELVPATIISKQVANNQRNYIINSGAKDSIKIGMPVVTEKGLLGIVNDVTSDFSLVRTIQNSNLRIAVLDQRSRVQGILNFDGKRLVLKNIPTTSDMEIGDRIVTSDFSTIFPPSIPVGIVSGKETEISGLLSNIYIKPFADLIKVKNVFVLKVVESKQIKNLELNLIK